MKGKERILVTGERVWREALWNVCWLLELCKHINMQVETPVDHQLSTFFHTTHLTLLADFDIGLQ